MLDLKKLSKEEKAKLLENAKISGDQCLINIIAEEFAREYYIPNPAITFDMFKRQFGYRETKEERLKILSKKLDF